MGWAAVCGLWACCTRTVFIYYFFSFIPSFRIKHHQFMLFCHPPTPFPNLWNLFDLLLSLFLMHIPSNYKENLVTVNSWRGLFPHWPLTWLNVILVTPGTPENTNWQYLPIVFLLNWMFLFVGCNCWQDGLLWPIRCSWVTCRFFFS